MPDAAESSTVSVLRRVGWMLGRYTDLNVSELRRLTAAAAPTMLDPHGGRRGPIDADWGVIVMPHRGTGSTSAYLLPLEHRPGDRVPMSGSD